MVEIWNISIDHRYTLIVYSILVYYISMVLTVFSIIIYHVVFASGVQASSSTCVVSFSVKN